MRKKDIILKISCCAFLFSVMALPGCTGESGGVTVHQTSGVQAAEDTSQTEDMSKAEDMSQTEEALIEKITQTEEATDLIQKEAVEPMITEVDWSNYFEEINGAAVIYDPTENCYYIYNQELALNRRSPCSTFKIISSLIALENGIIEPDHSKRVWSGEVFWNEEWNHDIDFSDAFHASCVWYFREVIDEIGKDMMQEELNKLQYGNCDISDWNGELNTNNHNPALTGFWIESSLLISPKEQVEVIERIFGDNTNYSEETRNQLKQVMLFSESNESDILIYGKTGMGKSYGIVVDSWFTGFADTPEKRIYFCVYLGETENKDVSSAKAREIAVEIVSTYLNESTIL